MNENNNNLPEIGKSQFTCPYCRVVAKQDWVNIAIITRRINLMLEHIFLDYRTFVNYDDQDTIDAFHQHILEETPALLKKHFLSKTFDFSKCQSCNDTAVWREKKMIYPVVSLVPEPNEDLDDKIKILYQEARSVHSLSARSAAALLRLCVEKLCVQANAKGKTLNEQIKSLVKKGVSQQIQQALDYCRVTGNSAVHPGVIDIEEDPETILILFSLINDIAQEIITKPKEMKEKYASLPSGTLGQIEKRDGNQ